MDIIPELTQGTLYATFIENTRPEPIEGWNTTDYNEAFANFEGAEFEDRTDEDDLDVDWTDWSWYGDSDDPPYKLIARGTTSHLYDIAGTNWSESYFFPTYYFVNDQVSNPITDRKYFVLTDTEKNRQNALKLCRKERDNPTLDIVGWSELFVKRLNEFYDDESFEDTCTFKFCAMTSILKFHNPKTKPLNYKISKKIKVSEDYWFNPTMLFPLSEEYEWKGGYRKIINDGSDILFSLMHDFLTSDQMTNPWEIMKLLLPFVQDDSDDLAKAMYWCVVNKITDVNSGAYTSRKAFRSYYSDAAISYDSDPIDSIDRGNIKDVFPVIYPKNINANGEYSSVETILKIIDSAKGKLTGAEDEDDNTEKQTFDVDDIVCSKAVINEGVFIDDYCYVFNALEYALAFADAMLEILSCDFWKDYNGNSAFSFIFDNMVVVKDDPPKTEKQQKAEKVTELEADENGKLREVPDAQGKSKMRKNDIRSDMRDPEASIFYLTDYNWSMNTKELGYMGLTVDDFQSLVVYELQPDRQVSYKKIAEGAIKSLGSAVDEAQKMAGETPLIGSLLSTSLVEGISATAVTALRNKFSSTVDESRAYASSTKWIDQLLTGYWVGQYEIPFFGNNFLKSDTTSGWSMGNLASSNEFLMNDLTFNVQDIPTWKYTPGEGEKIEVTFFLLNTNFANLMSNLKFLYSFTVGAYWLQESSISYRTPNLYRLICPGRFTVLYAAMSVNVEYAGKIKKYDEATAKRIFGLESSGSSDFLPFNRMIAGANSCNIPEAYKVTVGFKDITPQAFNVISNYLTNNKESRIVPDITSKTISDNPAEQKMKEIVGGEKK